MRSLFRTALGYFGGVPDDFCGTNVDGVRPRLRGAPDDPTALHGWGVALDGGCTDATEAMRRRRPVRKGGIGRQYPD
ncbi:MAG: hypothetical protein ABEH58_02780 [Haloplanus sp.]